MLTAPTDNKPDRDTDTLHHRAVSITSAHNPPSGIGIR
jgi:hypothetical protein